MELQNGKPRTVHSALFVDFDNIYLSFAEQDKQIASQFATAPDMWLSWLEQRMPCQNLDAEEGRRRILIRMCYLNPRSFAAFRPYFIRSAFEVVDCPPLTTRGKTSTDIHMVMDILDALNHTTCFDEFIILSGDADFTPVLLRLRKHARRSAVFSAGYVSPAYKASCDYMISQDVFIRNALGIIDHEEDIGIQIQEEAINGATADLLERLAARLYEVSVVPGGIEASELPQVYMESEEFRQGTHWLGFGSLRRLTQAVVAQRQDIAIVEEDPWRVARVRDEKSLVPASVPSEEEPTTSTQATHQDIRLVVSEWTQGIARASQSAISMAALAQAMIQRFGQHVPDTDWLGAGTFKNLLTELDLGSLRLSSVSPGFVYDPARHKVPVAGPSTEYARSFSTGPLDNFSLRYPDLAPLARKVRQLTDTPYLMPEHYALLLRELAREINESGYQMTRTSKTTRDRCVERGAPIARSHVNFVLVGIGYAGYRFGQNLPETPMRLGEALVQNTINLCRTAQLNLTDEEVSQIHGWILGALSEGTDH